MNNNVKAKEEISSFLVSMDVIISVYFYLIRYQQLFNYVYRISVEISEGDDRFPESRVVLNLLVFDHKSFVYEPMS